MFRYEIINRLLAERGAEAQYLEIGVADPRHCFDKVVCTHKTAVDPVDKFGPGRKIDYPLTSDAFFAQLEQGQTEFSPDQRWDVIFIDGLHLADQVFRDIQNALRHCQPDGFVVLHDCNPATCLAAHSDLEHFSKYHGEWNGSTWKALYRLRTESTLLSYTVDTDYGVGIIELADTQVPIEHTNPWFEFGHFKHHRGEQIGLISEAEFLRRH